MNIRSEPDAEPQTAFPAGEAVLDTALEVTYYTDPLCAWSWAFEPQWRRLRYEFGNRLRWRYRMGGVIRDWQSYSDPLNDVSRPVQMGPLWSQAKHISGMPIEDCIWLEDPPASSYPSCLAVKAAELQSPEAGEAYLRRLREAVMVGGRNIAKREVLLELAEQLNREGSTPFDAARFARDVEAGEALELFREDLKQARYFDVGRFPTLTLRGEGQGFIVVGYRPYDVLLAAVERAAPGLAPQRRAGSAAGYTAYWERATEREVAEALEPSPAGSS